MPQSTRDTDLDAGLELRRNARRGFALGAVAGAVVFVRFVLLPGTARPMFWFVGLAAVLGVSVGLLATLVLVGWRAHRLTRHL